MIQAADSSAYDRVRLRADDDLIVAIGSARCPTGSVRLLEYAHGLNPRIVGITDSSLSPLLAFTVTPGKMYGSFL